MHAAPDTNLSTQTWWRRWAPGLLLILLPFLLFWQIWWPDSDRRLVFAYGDFVEQYYPMRVFVAGELRDGRLPIWDPYTYSGGPIAAGSIAAAFYPLGFWQALFARPLPIWALQLEAIFHLSLAGVFTWLLVRRLTGSTGAGLIAGAAFSLGGFMTSYPVLQLAILETAMWLPVSLWLLELTLARRSLLLAALAGVALGCSILAGHPQTFLYIAYVWAGFLLLRAWHHRLGWRFTVAAALTAGGVTLGLGAALLLPTWEMAGLSPRAELSYSEVSHGFQLADLKGLWRPNPGQWSPLYVGLVPLGLALVGLFLVRRAESWFWASVAVLGLLLSLGQNGFLYPLAYRFVPGFAQFRDQERAAFVVSFALCVLAGYGYAALAQRRWWPRLLLPVLLCLVVLDLFRANSGIILQSPSAGGYFASTPAVEFLQQADAGVSRVSSEGLLPGDGNGGMVFRIRDVTGNSPLHLAHYDQFLEVVPELRWWQLLNVAFVLTQRNIEHGALSLVVDDGDQRLYQTFLGRQAAWVAHDFEVVPDQDAAIERAAHPALDPRTTVVLEEEPNPMPRPSAGPDHVRLVAFENHRVEAEVTLGTPGLLVLSEVSYPGWVARIDGQRVPTLRAYGLLRAVAVPAGSWRVEWRYQSLAVNLGVGLSLLALFLVGLAFAGQWVRRRRQSALLRARRFARRRWEVKAIGRAQR